MNKKVCLSCGYVHCMCGKEQWLDVLEPNLPAPKLPVISLLDDLIFQKAMSLADIIKTGKLSEYNSTVLETILMCMGYDNEQQTSIIGQIEAEGLALRQWQITPIQVGAAEKYHITNLQGQYLLNEKGQPRVFADFKQAVLTMQAENKAVA